MPRTPFADLDGLVLESLPVTGEGEDDRPYDLAYLPLEHPDVAILEFELEYERVRGAAEWAGVTACVGGASVSQADAVLDPLWSALARRVGQPHPRAAAGSSGTSGDRRPLRGWQDHPGRRVGHHPARENGTARAPGDDRPLQTPCRSAAERYRTYYIPGEELYLAEIRPAERADIVIDNRDFEAPRIVRDVPHRSRRS
jgi:hypothetical protein